MAATGRHTRPPRPRRPRHPDHAAGRRVGVHPQGPRRHPGTTAAPHSLNDHTTPAPAVTCSSPTGSWPRGWTSGHRAGTPSTRPACGRVGHSGRLLFRVPVAFDMTAPLVGSCFCLSRHSPKQGHTRPGQRAIRRRRRGESRRRGDVSSVRHRSRRFSSNVAPAELSVAFGRPRRPLPVLDPRPGEQLHRRRRRVVRRRRHPRHP
jgi:hypothetical protein